MALNLTLELPLAKLRTTRGEAVWGIKAKNMVLGARNLRLMVDTPQTPSIGRAVIWDGGVMLASPGSNVGA